MPAEGLKNTDWEPWDWHTNRDTYERVVADDAMKSSIVMAASVWPLANRAETLPGFTEDQMPRRPNLSVRPPAI